MSYDPLTGLITVFESKDEAGVDADLKKLDPRLFLVKEMGFHGEFFYEVRFWNGSEHEPSLITDWREDNGRPKPLSSGIVFDVQRQMKRGPLDLEAIIRRNEAHKQRISDEHQLYTEDAARDFERLKRLGSRTIMPRSQNTYANARRQRLRDIERYFGAR